MQSRPKYYSSENTTDFIIEVYWCYNAIEKRLMVPYNSTNCIMIVTNFWINIYTLLKNLNMINIYTYLYII